MHLADALITIYAYCHSPGGDTVVADRALYVKYAHSPQSENATALAEIVLSEQSSL